MKKLLTFVLFLTGLLSCSRYEGTEMFMLPSELNASGRAFMNALQECSDWRQSEKHVFYRNSTT